MDRIRRRFAPVLDALAAGEGETPDLATLAALAAWSPFHFHRQFRGLAGCTPAEWLRRTRLARAALQLAYRADRVGDIAAQAGYENAESFARAFRRLAGASPTAFRAHPDFSTLPPRSVAMPPDFTQSDLRFETVPARRIALRMHRGTPAALVHSLREFIAWRREHRLPPSRSATFNLLYEDPDAVAPADWRFGLACACDADVAPNPQGVEAAMLAGGRHAVLAYRGGDDALAAAIDFVYADWLPRSGEEPADAPLFVQRLELAPEVPERLALSELWLPLRGAD